MKTSINAWSVESGTGFAEMFRQISAAGFDGIELNLDTAPGSAHSLTMDTTDEQLEEIRALSIQYNLPVVSISSSMHGGKWGDHSPEVREEAKNILRRQIYLAKKLGASGILMVPGGMKEGRTLLDSWKNSVAAMREMKEEVRGCGVTIGIENVWNAFFTSPFDMLKFLDELDCPAYAVYFDAGNMDAFSNPEHWAEVLAGRIDKVHVKGYRRTNGGINQGGVWCNITDADIRWDKVVPMLKAGGFDGYLTAEVFPDEGETWEHFYKTTYEELKSLCEMAEK